MSTNAADSQPDWTRYGVSNPPKISETAEEQYKEDGPQNDELFNSDSERTHKAWWKANFLLTDTVKFGTWDGVFTSCMLNIFGVVIFLRTGWMVGIVGIGYSVVIIVLTMSIALIAVLGAIGVCERCQIEAGGVYFLVSHVLGSRIGASMGFLYCFGQAVASSLYIAGFGESICSLLGYTNPWIAKGIGIAVILLLLCINLAGIKWVIRLQLVLLLILFVAVLDFLVGSFIKWTPSAGVIGFDAATFGNNTYPRFSMQHDFFSVFGIFFPTATGVCAGINMSGNLHNPKRSIPLGTLAAIGVSFVLYLSFALVLAGKCTRVSLENDNMITSKVAFLGPFLLFGLYVSSLSSALGGISTAPKLLRAISETTKMPGSSLLSKSWGPSKVPFVSILCIVTVTLSFVLVGDIDVLGPIVTMPFLMTYGTLSYSYFVLAKSFDIRRRREELFEAISGCKRQKIVNECDSSDNLQSESVGDAELPLLPSNNRNFPCSVSSTLSTDRNILDKLFPEREMSYGAISSKSTEEAANQLYTTEIVKQPKSFYSRMSNRWVSLFGTVMFMALMFAVNWMYASICFAVWGLMYFYVGQISPGLFPGVSEFSLVRWLCRAPRSICTNRCGGETKLLLGSQMPTINIQSSCITHESKDYLARERYHQSKVIHDDKIMKALAGTDTDD